MLKYYSSMIPETFEIIERSKDLINQSKRSNIIISVGIKDVCIKIKNRHKKLYVVLKNNFFLE